MDHPHKKDGCYPPRRDTTTTGPNNFNSSSSSFDLLEAGTTCTTTKDNNNNGNSQGSSSSGHDHDEESAPILLTTTDTTHDDSEIDVVRMPPPPPSNTNFFVLTFLFTGFLAAMMMMMMMIVLPTTGVLVDSDQNNNQISFSSARNGSTIMNDSINNHNVSLTINANNKTSLQRTFETISQQICENMTVLLEQREICGQNNKEREKIMGPHTSSYLGTYLYNLTAKGAANGKYGTGNVVWDYAGFRLEAFAQGSTAVIWDYGHESLVERHAKVEPWISGLFAAASGNNRLHSPLNMTLPPKDYCPTGGARTEPLSYMIPLITYDLRRMAIALVGVPSASHPSADFETKFLRAEARRPPFTPLTETGTVYRLPIHDYFENGPVFPNVTLDDAVIHFRCGDILAGVVGPFHYPKYEEFARVIAPDTKSIGIVTQPFSVGKGLQTRDRDKIETTGQRCRVLVLGLVEYLKERFPEARYTIHNGPGETVALAYARMIMAKQTLALIPSSFSVFPAIATFGQGYMTRPRRGNPDFAGSFLNHEMTKGLYRNQPVLLDILPRMIFCKNLERMWKEGDEKVLQWFQNPEPPT